MVCSNIRFISAIRVDRVDLDMALLTDFTFTQAVAWLSISLSRFCSTLLSGQHQPSVLNPHPDLDPDLKPGGLQPSAAYLNPGHCNRYVGRTWRSVCGGVVIIELTDGKPLLGGDFYRCPVRMSARRYLEGFPLKN
jgi:hypothetical protein